MSSGHDQHIRGELMRQQGRYDDAVGYFKEAISANPENDSTFAELAMCYMEMEGHRKDALTAIENAIALDPEDGGYRSIKSLTLSRLDRGKAALAAADEAIEIDPEEAFAYTVKAQAYMTLERWGDAEEQARRSLVLDGDNHFASNLLAMSLRLQGKQWENDQTVDQLLSDNPEDALTHFNAGWSALQKHDSQKAEEHFKEALRIDPSFEGARQGLIESFAARSAFYRVYLRYCFFMQRFTEKARWAIVIGFYLAFRFGRVLLSKINPILGVIFAALYVIFALWVWLASGIGHFLILLDSSARQALKKSEKLDGLAVGGGLLVGITILILGAVVSLFPLLVLGGALCAGALPATLTLTNASKRGRWVFGSIMVYVYLVGVGVCITEWIRGGEEISELSSNLLLTGLILTVICTWIGNLPSLRKETVE